MPIDTADPAPFMTRACERNLTLRLRQLERQGVMNRVTLELGPDGWAIVEKADTHVEQLGAPLPPMYTQPGHA